MLILPDLPFSSLFCNRQYQYLVLAAMGGGFEIEKGDQG